MSEGWGFETRQIHAGQQADPTTGARAVPIYQTTSYQFRDSASAANLFALAEIGNIYTRIMNPTQGVLEARLASLEGAPDTAVGLPGALAVASGQAAEMLAILNLAGAGDHIVSSPSLYGGTYNLFHYTLPKIGIEVTFVDDPDDLEQWRAAVRPNTKAFFAETLANPKNDVLDLEGVSGVAHDNGVPLIVDNTVPTPYLIRPLEWGADIVVHSTTKFLGGHGTSIGGAIIDGGTFDFSASGKFPGFTEPDPSYHGLAYWPALGPGSYIIKARVQLLRDLGPALSPFNAFLTLQGIETLSLRMERHFSNAQKVAEWLVGRDEVERVIFAGLPDSPWHERAQRYGGGKGAGSIVAFIIKGGRDAGQRFVDALELHSHVANIGDVRSLVIHPASTTHSQLTEEEQRSTGVEPGLVRLSVGLETIDDILADLDAGFRAAEGVSQAPPIDNVSARAWVVLLLAATANVLPAMNLSIMNVVYRDIQEAFPDVSPAQLSWVLSAYTVVSAATLVIGGVAADRLGRKRALLGGCTGFALGSALCGSAGNVNTIIAGRIVLGIAASFVVTSNVSLALREFPASRRSSAFGVIASFGGLAAAAGPTVGSLVLEHGGWRWAFWINVPIAMLIVLVGARVFTESRDPNARAFPDIFGAGLLLVGVALGIVAVVQSPTWGWIDPRTAACLVASAVLLGWMLWRCTRHPAPIIDLTLFRSRNLSLFNVMAFFVSIGWFGMFFAMVQFLRTTWEYDVLQAGLLVTPIPFGAGVLGVLGGRFADRFGYRSMLIVGSIAFVLGSLWMIFALGPEPDIAAWMIGIIPIAIGTGLVFPSFQAGAVIDTPSEQYAVAVGVNQTIQRIGSAVGGAVAIAFLASVGPAGALDRILIVMCFAAVVCIPTALALRSTRAAV